MTTSVGGEGTALTGGIDLSQYRDEVICVFRSLSSISATNANNQLYVPDRDVIIDHIGYRYTAAGSGNITFKKAGDGVAVTAGDAVSAACDITATANTFYDRTTSIIRTNNKLAAGEVLYVESDTSGGGGTINVVFVIKVRTRQL